MFNTPPPQEQHQMQLEKTHDSGAEEWFCPTCGRRTLMYYHADTRQLDFEVLEPGDPYATHAGSKGGIQIGSFETNKDEEVELPEYLQSALEDVLSRFDFDDLADSEED